LPRQFVAANLVINIFNPKLSIFFLAFLPQFIGADEAYPLLRMLELSGAFMAMTFAVFVVYGLFAAFVRDRIVTRAEGDDLAAPRLCRRVCRAGCKTGVRGAVGDPASYSRHCERSEAIHLPATEEWIVSSLSLLAMTMAAMAPGIKKAGSRPAVL
jgi:hypothetical protein